MFGNGHSDQGTKFGREPFLLNYAGHLGLSQTYTTSEHLSGKEEVKGRDCTVTGLLKAFMEDAQPEV